MTQPIRRLFVGLCLLVSVPFGGDALAQSNVIPGTDVKLGSLGSLNNWGRNGTFPNGVSGISFSTTSCNVGSVDVPWEAPMEADHPFIAFMILRESNGRLEQISDYSFVKHGFYALSNSQCTPCQNPNNTGLELGVGCSDTYSSNNNGDQYWLGPPQEIDPWLGTWDPVCSHFDMGEPSVGPPNDCNGIRSLSVSQAQALGPVGHRINVLDADLDVAGADFWYAGSYIIRGEPVGNRVNNMGSRRMLAGWSGSSWSLAASGSFQEGTPLQRWSGVTVAGSSNGADDGHFYVGVTSEDLGGGLYHYEYAVHNQDNQRGGGGLRIPLAPGATVSNASFRDIDQDGANDWSIQQVGAELVFSTGSNPIQWNTIYNFSFDVDAAPVSGTVQVDQFLAGAGQPSVGVVLTTPEGAACPQPTTYCTAKTNSELCAPLITFSGLPSASAGSGFDIDTDLVIANTNGLLFYSKTGPDATPFQGGFLCAAAPVRRTLGQNSGGAGPCGGSFTFDFNAYIAAGSDAGLVAGQGVWGQYWYRDPASPSTTGLTDAITFSICP